MAQRGWTLPSASGTTALHPGERVISPACRPTSGPSPGHRSVMTVAPESRYASTVLATTITGSQTVATFFTIHDKRGSSPNGSAALSRPIRLLRPPARMIPVTCVWSMRNPRSPSRPRGLFSAVPVRFEVRDVGPDRALHHRARTGCSSDGCTPRRRWAMLDLITGPMTGQQYLDSLQDGREIYIYGERVKNVVTHP